MKFFPVPIAGPAAGADGAATGAATPSPPKPFSSIPLSAISVRSGWAFSFSPQIAPPAKSVEIVAVSIETAVAIWYARRATTPRRQTNAFRFSLRPICRASTANAGPERDDGDCA
ncbi:MAG: hypothetical protein IPF82_16365 [Blastocatellia bacterium]|nr:hypothetical protein [Blastocatellia bacterium]